MKKTIYQSPRVCVFDIVGQELMVDGSMKIDGSNKVENSNDIGFVKERKSRDDYDAWDEDWSQ